MSLNQPSEDLKMPEFKSDIPSYLLNDATDRDKWILTKLQEIDFKTGWQTTILNMLYREAKKTNGRVTTVETKVNKIEKEKDFIAKFVYNKYFWAVIAAWFLVVYPIFILKFGPVKINWLWNLFG